MAAGSAELGWAQTHHQQDPWGVGMNAWEFWYHKSLLNPRKLYACDLKKKERESKKCMWLDIVSLHKS